MKHNLNFVLKRKASQEGVEGSASTPGRKRDAEKAENF